MHYDVIGMCTWLPNSIHKSVHLESQGCSKTGKQYRPVVIFRVLLNHKKTTSTIFLRKTPGFPVIITKIPENKDNCIQRLFVQALTWTYRQNHSLYKMPTTKISAQCGAWSWSHCGKVNTSNTLLMEHWPERDRHCWHSSLIIITVIERTVQPGGCAEYTTGHVAYFNGRDSADICMTDMQ